MLSLDLGLPIHQVRDALIDPGPATAPTRPGWYNPDHADPARPGAPFDMPYIHSGNQPSPSVVITATTTTNGLASAINAARADQSGHYRIEVTSPSLAGDLMFWTSRPTDFHAAGGSLVIRYTGPGHCDIPGSFRFETTRGITFERFRFSKETDVYADSQGAILGGVPVVLSRGAAINFRDCQFGVGWRPGGTDPMRASSMIVAQGGAGSEPAISEIVIDGCLFRGVATAFRPRAGVRAWFINNVVSEHYHDVVYASIGLPVNDPEIHLWFANNVIGQPYNGTLAYAVVDAGDFVLGERVTQAGTGATGVISRIVRAADASANPWGGQQTRDVIFFELETAALEPDLTITGATSGDTVTPTYTDTYWAWPGGTVYVAGYVHVGGHTDVLQWGVPNGDGPNTVYRLYAENNVALTGAPNMGATQGFFGEQGVPGARQYLYFRNNHLGVSGGWGMAVPSPHAVIQNTNIFMAPMGEIVPTPMMTGSMAVNEQPTHPFLRLVAIDESRQDIEAQPVLEQALAANLSVTQPDYWDTALPPENRDFRVARWDLGPANGNGYAQVYGLTPAPFNVNQYLETPPAMPDTDDLTALRETLRAWVRDNRRPPAGWDNAGWVDPTRFADV